MATDDLLDRFKREYELYHGLSADRIQRQQKCLREFADHAGRPLIECDGEQFGAWLSSLVESGLHVNTVRGRGNMIRPFFTWAYEKGLVTGDQLMSIRAVKNPRGSTSRSLPKPYSAKELAAWRTDLNERWPLLDDFKLRYYRDGRSGIRRVAPHSMHLQIEAIVGLALYCGLRRSEIFNLTIDDMHPDNAYVVVRQRGERATGKDRFREVPHTRQSREKLTAWLDWRELLNPGHEQPWISLATNQPEGVWKHPLRFERFKELLTTVGPYRLHRFRHTCATHWLRAGMSLEQVSRLLGHSSVQQTLGYAEIVRDDLQRTVEKLEDTFEQQINGDAVPA